MNHIIVKKAEFNQPIEKVWSAITNASEISSWFLKADFKAEKGYQYTFNSTGEDCSPIIGEVKEATPYTLIYTWIVKETPAETTVKWVLTPTQTGTSLHLEHSGIENYAGETAVAMFNSFNGGWDHCLNGLTTYLKEPAHAR